MFLIPRVYALGAVAGKKVFVERQAGSSLQHRYAFLFRSTGVDGRLVDDDIAFFQRLADSF